MEVEIKTLRKKDFNKARKFAIKGMNLTRYTERKLDLYLYSKYFWYLELIKSSRVLGAYIGDNLVGVLLAEFDNEPKVYESFFYKLYIKTFEFIGNFMFQDGVNDYDLANENMVKVFKKIQTPDGVINFFAVDPTIKGKGIGTHLLKALEKEAKDKLIYLFTDSECTYQFYEHRGFIKSGEEEITLVIHKKEIPLTCFLYSKKI